MFMLYRGGRRNSRSSWSTSTVMDGENFSASVWPRHFVWSRFNQSVMRPSPSEADVFEFCFLVRAAITFILCCLSISASSLECMLSAFCCHSLSSLSLYIVGKCCFVYKWPLAWLPSFSYFVCAAPLHSPPPHTVAIIPPHHDLLFRHKSSHDLLLLLLLPSTSSTTTSTTPKETTTTSTLHNKIYDNSNGRHC